MEKGGPIGLKINLIDLIDLINLISKKAPIGKLGFGIYLGQLEIRIIRNFTPTSSGFRACRQFFCSRLL